MAKDIEEVFKMPGGKEKYWDEVALREKHVQSQGHSKAGP